MATKRIRSTTVDDKKVETMVELYYLIEQGKLFDLQEVARMVPGGRCVRYLRRLCHAELVDHHKILGRYYMTREEIGALVKPVKAQAKARVA